MRASEILQLVKNEFPDLTEKTLRQWKKVGLLQESERVGRGTNGVIAEWADDSVARIKLIKTIAGERVNMDKARMVLIANGYWLGASIITDTFNDLFDQLETQRGRVRTKIKTNRPDAINSTGVLNVTLVLAIADMIFAAQDVREGRLTPALRLVQMAEIESVRDLFAALEDNEIEDFYKKSAFIYDAFQPVLCYLFGYTDEYDSNSPLGAAIKTGWVSKTNAPFGLEKYQFEFILRIYSLVGFTILEARQPQIIEEIRRLILQNTTVESVKMLSGKVLTDDECKRLESEKHELQMGFHN